jgi:tetratricopeptide (TPR) repeat protein
MIADVFGYSEQLLERSYGILKCDPRRSLSWFNTARTALRAGNKEEALRIAREGSEIAPGGWLSIALIRALVANGLHEEARKEINDRIQDGEIALALKALIAAHEGDRARYEQLYEQFKVESSGDDFWTITVAAWGGHREDVNRLAAKIDQHQFGMVPLANLSQWCGCGAPWDLDATPNFAAKIKEGSLTWPPQPTMEFPLKDW